ncbi:hypothetical protein GCM10027093_21390 [Paraburkholderia jirisanensis]
MSNDITFERNALYDEVWTDPVSVVALRYRISDNGLRKICKKLGVPLPPLGYWAKLRAGQKLKQTPLPKHHGAVSFRARPDVYSHRGADPSETKDIFQAIDEEELLPANKVTPTTEGDWQHALVRALAKKLQAVDAQLVEEDKPRKAVKWEPQWDRIKFTVIQAGGLIGVSGDFLSITVTPAVRQRALSIADGFLVAVEARGFKVRIDSGKTIISNRDVIMQLRMSEMAEKTRPGYGIDTWDALGRLRIILRREGCDSGAPSEIKVRDELGRVLESQLNTAIAKLRKAVIGYKDREQSRKIALRRAGEEQLRVQCLRWHETMADEAARAQKRSFDLVLEEADMWEAIERRRRYIDHLEQVARARGFSVAEDSAIGNWLAWARDTCRILDPTDMRLSTLNAGLF